MTPGKHGQSLIQNLGFRELEIDNRKQEKWVPKQREGGNQGNIDENSPGMKLIMSLVIGDLIKSRMEMNVLTQRFMQSVPF